MGRSNAVIAVSLAAAVASAQPARAADVVLDVDAASGPWAVAANRTLMPYGQGDEKPPSLVKFDVAAGKVAIFADGTTSIPGHSGIGAGGIERKAVDDTLAHKKRFPSFYTPKILYPVNQHALIAAFVDDKGLVVGRPFAVGTGVRVTLPDGATALALGFNDASFAGNTGTLKVTVETPN